MAKKSVFKWVARVEVSVSKNWIEDGFDLSERREEIEEAVRAMLPYAVSGELGIKVTISSAPKKEDIRAAQNGE